MLFPQDLLPGKDVITQRRDRFSLPDLSPSPPMLSVLFWFESRCYIAQTKTGQLINNCLLSIITRLPPIDVEIAKHDRLLIIVFSKRFDQRVGR